MGVPWFQASAYFQCYYKYHHQTSCSQKKVLDLDSNNKFFSFNLAPSDSQSLKLSLSSFKQIFTSCDIVVTQRSLKILLICGHALCLVLLKGSSCVPERKYLRRHHLGIEQALGEIWGSSKIILRKHKIFLWLIEFHQGSLQELGYEAIYFLLDHLLVTTPLRKIIYPPDMVND